MIPGAELVVLALAVLLLGLVLGRLSRPEPALLPVADLPAPLPLPAPPADRIAIESLNDAVLVTRGAMVEAANAPARALFGERIAGSDIRLTVRHPLLLDTLDAVLADGVAAERELGGLGSGNRAFRLRVVPEGDGQEGGGRCLLLLDDVTDAKATERMRVDFVANASHELRTPLATLTGFIETLQGPAAEDEPARQRFLGIMGHEADRMRRLIDDLMSLSRIELDKFVRPTQQLTLTHIVAEVGRTLAIRLDADQRRLLIDEPPDVPPVIADRDQVLQVLHNLISNALKYGRSGTPIRVTLAVHAGEGGHVRLTVTDEGDGIAPEHLPRLTERFYRVDSQRSRTMGGTGLGLAIVKHIIERHRGRLEIDSRLGVGTSVSFTLPLA
jgi:two-component system, OmpR family, phosphate regulon sensor histidine kinase PhoR